MAEAMGEDASTFMELYQVDRYIDLAPPNLHVQ